MNAKAETIITEEEQELKKAFQRLAEIREQIATKTVRTGEASKINKNDASKAQTLQEAEVRAEQTRKKVAEGQLAFAPSSDNRTSFKKRKKVFNYVKDTQSTDYCTDVKVGEQNSTMETLASSDFGNQTPVRDVMDGIVFQSKINILDTIPKKKTRTSESTDTPDGFNTSADNGGFSSGGFTRRTDNAFASSDQDIELIGETASSATSVEFVGEKRENTFPNKGGFGNEGNDGFSNTGFGSNKGGFGNNFNEDSERCNSNDEEGGFVGKSIHEGERRVFDNNEGGGFSNTSFGNSGFRNSGFGVKSSHEDQRGGNDNNAGGGFSNSGFGNSGFGGSSRKSGGGGFEINATNDGEGFSNSGFGNSSFGGNSDDRKQNNSFGGGRFNKSFGGGGGNNSSGGRNRGGGRGRGSGGRGGRGVCNFFARTGNCKYGDTCKFSHEQSSEDGGSSSNNRGGGTSHGGRDRDFQRTNQSGHSEQNDGGFGGINSGFNKSGAQKRGGGSGFETGGFGNGIFFNINSWTSRIFENLDFNNFGFGGNSGGGFNSNVGGERRESDNGSGGNGFGNTSFGNGGFGNGGFGNGGILALFKIEYCFTVLALSYIFVLMEKKI
ncbi:C3H1-type domain-containing protein [Meloidogyne graminicola]|uniref:C3H1-type domain-containing protein n=1 Tax=Meloidogyne graminicola TaxID=189291 RepID=A0A8S9ZT93_9BILA|nr:C3H1-type domain-containing protein [Meloidogyne graminicola]